MANGENIDLLLEIIASSKRIQDNPQSSLVNKMDALEELARAGQVYRKHVLYIAEILGGIE